MAVPVQVIFQGGGARLAALLAAADAVQILHNSNELKVTSVAGTSAGSIAAAMLATNQPISSFVNKVRPLFEQHYPSFARPIRRNKRVRRFVAKALPGRFQTALSIFWGDPLYNEEALRAFIKTLLCGEKGAEFTLGSLPIPVRIITTDLRHQYAREYHTSSDDMITDIILNSCAIPFAFRAFNEPRMIVDGGLCANLPVPPSSTNDPLKGVPLAFSFPNEASSSIPGDPVTYAMLLVSTAIQNSINEARGRVESMGGKVVHIPTTLSTFDFHKAMEYLASTEYSATRDNIKVEILGWLQEHLRSQKLTRFHSERQRADFYVDAVAQIMSSLFENRAFEIAKSAILVTANCLFPLADPRSRIPDHIEMVVKLQPRVENLRVFSVALLGGISEEKPGSEWQVYDSSGRKSGALSVILNHPDGGEKLNAMGIFFDPALSKERGPYTLRHAGIQHDSMIRLKKQGFDWAWYQSEQAIITVSELVVRLPRDYEDVTLRDLSEEKEHIPEERKPETLLGPMTGEWRCGREMTDRELEEYTLGGYKCVGWCAANMQSGDRMGVMLLRSAAAP